MKSEPRKCKADTERSVALRDDCKIAKNGMDLEL